MYHIVKIITIFEESNVSSYMSFKSNIVNEFDKDSVMKIVNTDDINIENKNKLSNLYISDILDRISKVLPKKYIFVPSLSESSSMITISDNKGRFYFTIYWFDDKDDDSIYITNININYNSSTKIYKYYNKIIDLYLLIGYELNVTCSIFVTKDSELYEYYINKGFNEVEYYDEKNNIVWMEKRPE